MRILTSLQTVVPPTEAVISEAEF